MTNEYSEKSTSPANGQVQRVEAMVRKLDRFYSVVGKAPEEIGALALMAEYLCQAGTDEQIAGTLTRCAFECKYPIRLPDILQRIPGHEVPQLEAEARKAWDVLNAFVRKYVGNDPFGNYGPEYGWYPESFPKLRNRILDTVRRTGSWKVYACMTTEDFPFVQKRFFEEYEAWTAVNEINPAVLCLLTEKPIPQLHAATEPAEQKRVPPKPVAHVLVKPIPQPMTDVELRDRREILRQQVVALAAKGRQVEGLKA